MSIQDKVRTAAANRNLDITQQQLNRLVSTLRYSQLRTASNLDPLIQKELTSLVKQIQQQHPAATMAAQDANAAMASEATFKQIDDSLVRGSCPRCGKKMREVQLADYTPALFCEGECRITLWAQQPAEQAEQDSA